MKLPWASNAELPTKCSEEFEKPDGFCAYLVELTFVRKFSLVRRAFPTGGTICEGCFFFLAAQINLFAEERRVSIMWCLKVS